MKMMAQISPITVFTPIVATGLLFSETIQERLLLEGELPLRVRGNNRGNTVIHVYQKL
jgi:hypothetical protein